MAPRGGRGGSASRAPFDSAEVCSGHALTSDLLALRFLALALHARLLVVLAATGLGKDAALLDLLVEPAQGTLEAFVLTHTDFCQSGNHLLWGSFAMTATVQTGFRGTG